MSTPRIQRKPYVLKEIVNMGLLGEDPFMLFDVGASGGIEDFWFAWDPVLHAVGFDPLKREVERLNRQSHSGRIHYVDTYVGIDEFGSFPPLQASSSKFSRREPEIYNRLSSSLAQEIANYSFTERFNNDNPDVVFSDKKTSIDRFCLEENINNVDFLKIDTDGDDYEVILGAKKSLGGRGVLGLFVECQLHGMTHEHSNIFSNIDRVLRGAGFALFDLEVHRYTRRALPGKFQYDIFAQTLNGQVIWGDALYLRDYASDGYAERWGTFPMAKVLKLVGIYELFGLYDCAAELLLLVAQQRVGEKLPVGKWLDHLTIEMEPNVRGYRDLMSKFSTRPTDFFPGPHASPTI